MEGYAVKNHTAQTVVDIVVTELPYRTHTDPGEELSCSLKCVLMNWKSGLQVNVPPFIRSLQSILFCEWVASSEFSCD